MNSTIPPIPPQDKPLQWNPFRDPLPDEGPGTVTIILEGLFSICYLDRGEFPLQCQIGVFNKDPKHKLTITINGGTCTGDITGYEYTHAQVKQLADKKFKIRIVDADPDVSFYQRDNVFNRATSNVQEDFRWLVDVEKPDLYNKITGSKQPHYGPKILVKNGVFFTSAITTEENLFDFVEWRPGRTVQQLGYIARKTAARIVLSPEQVLMFEFQDPDGDDKTCRFESGQPPATVLIQNLCWELGARCEEGDFHLHFGSFKPPRGKRKFTLVRRDLIPPDEELGVPPGATSDEAPCHAMGYGQSGGGTQP